MGFRGPSTTHVFMGGGRAGVWEEGERSCTPGCGWKGSAAAPRGVGGRGAQLHPGVCWCPACRQQRGRLAGMLAHCTA